MPRRKQEQPKRFKYASKGRASGGAASSDGEEEDLNGEDIIEKEKDGDNDTNSDCTDNVCESTKLNGEGMSAEKTQQNNSTTNNDNADVDHEQLMKSNKEAKSPVLIMPTKMEILKSPPRLEIDEKRDSEIQDSKSKVKDEIKVNKAKKHSRPETPPLQRLMKQDPLPLFMSKHSHHSPAKKIMKEGYFQAVPFSMPSPSSIKHAPTHPKQTLSYKSKMYSNKLQHKLFDRVPLHHKSSPSSSSSSSHHNSDQPLDLSKKSSSKGDNSHKKDTKSNKHFNNGYMSRNLSSSSLSSLESLQQRFGGDLHMRYMRKPISGLMPVIPDVLPRSFVTNSQISKTINSLPKLSPKLNKTLESEKLERTGVSPKSNDNSSQGQDLMTDLNSNLKSKSNESIQDGSISKGGDDKYTNHRCTCKESFNNLFDLSVHLTNTGHLPAGYKQSNLMDYPKLVRGQDMWLNQESEQTKRILRCMQCGESFRSLPMLTVHMMQTQHYTKIVSSEHGRRSHKCSAYCDREMDRECIFKCKVCNSAFTDMEGLANHMILSGHHKKNVLRSNNYLEFGLKSRRKRYLSEESLDMGCNPTVAALLEYKRKCLSQSFTLPSNGHSRLADSPNSDPPDDSTISCENCGERIETNSFVEHVRMCLRQRGEKSSGVRHTDDTGSEKSELMESQDYDEDEENLKMFEKPSESEDDEMDSKSNDQPDIIANKDVKNKLSVNEKEKLQGKGDNEKKDADSSSEEKVESDDFEVEMESTKEESKKDLTKSEIEKVSTKSELEKDSTMSALEKNSTRNELEKDLTKSKLEKELTKSGLKREKIKEENKDNYGDEESKLNEQTYGEKSDHVQSLDIIDPSVGSEGSDGDSALQAMQSFIQKSFSMKFNYKRGNVVLNANDNNKSVNKSSNLNSEESKKVKTNPLYLFEKYKHFQPLQPNNGNIKMAEELSNTSEGSENPENSLKNDLQKLEKLCKNVEKSASPNKETVNSKSDKNSTERSGSVESDHSEHLASKYLNVDEEENTDSSGKEASNSALDSLSSFVYGQSLTSEHPLDSLQKLITKTDIPSLIATRGNYRILPRTESPADSSVPLNLSIKKEKDDDENEESDLKDYFSDHDGSGSSSDSDGNMEYRCTACSRHFASKGSYRYHLSRCHLSSVKRYGLKEAFNMSPYIYLPLDHTAKFSKYYEMAQELANKGK
ncbi:hypothetical protein KUTeg_020028 [Tegillarca granosa]|uniref:C2H2-type domain-containing protein n=1 Tax=Tegillarca granosa TaxID=220873 RepID=A0ABQ9EI70_TEGGR|nr:hypothetical protein KUTeg_020028 [Tegillarca granosa]